VGTTYGTVLSFTTAAYANGDNDGRYGRDHLVRNLERYGEPER
jgi:hypothetical protein